MPFFYEQWLIKATSGNHSKTLPWCLLHARHYFIQTNSFSPHHKAQKLSNVSTVTSYEIGELELDTRLFGFRIHALDCFLYLGSMDLLYRPKGKLLSFVGRFLLYLLNSTGVGWKQPQSLRKQMGVATFKKNPYFQVMGCFQELKIHESTLDPLFLGLNGLSFLNGRIPNWKLVIVFQQN